MAYLVLARKYRPQVFEDIVGQGHVTRTLANAITADRVAHAYLFCGPRGVGKTTAARILAKALNCEKGPAPVPCNTCSACEEVTGGRSMDVLEIDGASNRGINEVRELRENTRYAPSNGRYKVYIIDEVHMLTNEAFNALLKTLEEPPSHVVFVLATTEPFKMPPTILSRCQRFDFARIPAREITGHLERLMKSEKVKASPEALALVSRRASGGLRDALSLMDQVISSAQGKIDRETVEQILGLVGSEFFDSLTATLADGDAGSALKMLSDVYVQGADLGELSDGLTAHLRDLLLLRIDDGLASILDASESEVSRLKEQAERFSRESLAELVDRAAETTAALRKSDHPRLTLELALAEMAEVSQRVPLGELAERLLQLEQTLGGGTPSDAGPGGGGSAPRRSAPAKPSAPKKKPTSRAAPPQAVHDPAIESVESEDPAPRAPVVEGDLWGQFLQGLKEKSRPLWSMLNDGEFVNRDGRGNLVVRIDNPMAAGRLAAGDTQELLRGVLAALGEPGASVVLEGSQPSPQKAEAEDPPAPEKDERTMGQVFRDEPMLQRALDMFDGEVL